MWGIDGSRNLGSGNRGNLVEVVPRGLNRLGSIMRLYNLGQV